MGGCTVPDRAEGVGILADDVLAEQSVDEAHDPDNADEHLV